MNSDDDIGRDLAAFLDEHRACGTLDTGLTGQPERVWMFRAEGRVFLASRWQRVLTKLKEVGAYSKLNSQAEESRPARGSLVLIPVLLTRREPGQSVLVGRTVAR